MSRIRGTKREKGAVLLLFAFAITTIMGAMGLSFDIGRMYMAKTEGQAYADAAALAAVIELNGTLGGITAAQAQITSGIWKNNNFSNVPYVTTGGSPEVQYWFCTSMECNSSSGTSSPGSGAGYRYVRVETTANVPMFLLPLITGANTANVWAGATAGQLKEVYWTDGLWPFFTFDHSYPGEANNQPGNVLDGYGFQKNRWYAFAWGNKAGEQLYKAFQNFGGFGNSGTLMTGAELLAQPASADPDNPTSALGLMAKFLRGQANNLVSGNDKIANRDEWCEGDADERFLRATVAWYIANGEGAIFTPSGGAYPTDIMTLFNDKGFYRLPGQINSGTNVITSMITQGVQDGAVTIGDPLVHYPGQRAAVQQAIVDLINSDPSNSPLSNTNVDQYWTITDYNEARVVYTPIVNANSSLGNKATSNTLDFRAFLLLTDGPCGNNNNNCNSFYQDNPAPRQHWCYAYMGDELKNSGGRPPALGGIFVARLIR